MENISQHADFILHQFEQLDRSRSNGDMKGKSQVQPGKVLRETQFAKVRFWPSIKREDFAACCMG